jgi:hypothetical protein
VRTWGVADADAEPNTTALVYSNKATASAAIPTE